MPFHLERVDANNIAHVVALGKELVALGTFGQTGPEFDWDYTLRSTQHVLTNERYYLATAVDDSGAYVGFVAGHLDLFFFAPKLMGIEDCWYVREHTPSRGKIAAALMMSFVDWCYLHVALLVQSGDIASINTIGVDALYRRMGFTRYGVIYKHARDV